RDPRALHSFPTRRSSDLAQVSADSIDVLVTAGVDGTLRMWPASKSCDVPDQRVTPSNTFRNDQFSLTSVSVSSDYNYAVTGTLEDRKSTRLNSSHVKISY